jgi:hypothetical protein
MLNPLARRKPNRSSDITSDFEGPLSTDTAGYIGNRKQFLSRLLLNDRNSFHPIRIKDE